MILNLLIILLITISGIVTPYLFGREILLNITSWKIDEKSKDTLLIDYDIAHTFLNGNEDFKQGETVYVILNKNYEYWTISKLQKDRPTNGEICVRGYINEAIPYRDRKYRNPFDEPTGMIKSDIDNSSANDKESLTGTTYPQNDDSVDIPKNVSLQGSVSIEYSLGKYTVPAKLHSEIEIRKDHKNSL